MQFSDAHIHIAELTHFAASLEGDVFLPVCAAAHFPNDFEKMQKIAAGCSNQIEKSFFFTFGLHPQNPDFSFAAFLETLAREKRIAAIGECGFDFFDERLRGNFAAQKRAWDFQLDLARRFDLPILVHCRKAIDKIFADSKRLKSLRAVIFHSWTGSPREAESLLQRGVNAYFAIGKQVLNGRKLSLASAQKIDGERILCETDAPYQTLAGESETPNSQIRAIHEKVAQLRGISLADCAEVCVQNLLKIFSSDKIGQ